MKRIFYSLFLLLSCYATCFAGETSINNETTLTLHVATPGTLSDLIFDAGTRPVLVAKLTLTGTLNDDDFTCMRETMTSLVDVDLSGITNTSGVNFSGKAGLMRIILPTNLTSIGDMAFMGCSSLTSVTIPNSVTSIGEYAFCACTSLTSITIGNSVTSIGRWAFEYCSSLTSVVWNAKNCADFDYYSRPFIDSSSEVRSFIFGNEVEYIPACLCHDMTNLTTLSLGNSVTSIGDRAFASCSSLTSITIGNSVTSIGDRAFYYCSSLTSITIPNSVTTVGGGMFCGCSKLKSVVLSNNITYLPHYYDAERRYGFFENCSSLTSVTIPNSVTSIGNYAFEGCSSLTSVTIPNSVTSIEFSAFYGCSSLTSVTIPNSVTSIGDWAFSSCTSLTSIICLGTTPPDASNLGANTSTCKLIVPHSAYNAYLRHAYWGQFLNIVSGDWVVTLLANNNRWGEVTGGGLYSNNTTITITATPYDGYSFLRWSDGNTDNPRTLTVTKDITLTAEFVENRDITIIFTNSEDNDSEILSQVLTITIPAAPEIEGFTFLYWQPVAEPLTDTITIQAIYEANAPASAPEVYVNPANPAQKLLRNGQVYILKDDKIYTIMGAQIQ